MNVSQIRSMPEYFDRYIHCVPEENLSDALKANGPALIETFSAEIMQLGNRVYAPGKWTIADIIQHLIDSERVFTYRAMRFARNDQTVLAGFDENLYAAEAHRNIRDISLLLEEFKNVRAGSINLFDSFDETEMQRTGQTFAGSISVLALGFTLAGHDIHHVNVMKERYFPLLQNQT